MNPPKIKSSSNYPCSAGNLSLNLWMMSKKQKRPAGEAARHRDLIQTITEELTDVLPKPEFFAILIAPDYDTPIKYRSRVPGEMAKCLWCTYCSVVSRPGGPAPIVLTGPRPSSQPVPPPALAAPAFQLFHPKALESLLVPFSPISLTIQ